MAAAKLPRTLLLSRAEYSRSTSRAHRALADTTGRLLSTSSKPVIIKATMGCLYLDNCMLFKTLQNPIDDSDGHDLFFFQLKDIVDFSLKITHIIIDAFLYRLDIILG